MKMLKHLLFIFDDYPFFIIHFMSPVVWLLQSEVYQARIHCLESWEITEPRVRLSHILEAIVMSVMVLMLMISALKANTYLRVM